MSVLFSVPLSAMVLATTATTQDAGQDPLSWLQGDWKVVHTQTGETLLSCEGAQEFRVSADRSAVELKEKTIDDWALNYRVVRVEDDRILLIVENEDRLTEEGDPVLWWATFEGRDAFRWRRYDWEAENFTDQWQRCVD